MPNLSPTTLLRRLADRPASAAIFLYGDEDYLREDVARRVIALLLDPATRDFNLDQLRGSDATPETLGSLLATPPMMAEYRLVVVRDAQGLSPKARETIEAAVRRPHSGVVLILVATVPSGSKARFYDTLKKEALSVEFASVDPLDLPGWLVEHADAVHGLEIEMDAARALAAAIGSQLGVLASEVEKAAAYIGDRKTITLDDIRAVGGYIPRVDRWGWFDLIGARRFAEALGQLPELLDSGESGVGLVIGVGGHILRLGLLVGGGKDALERHLEPRQRWLAGKLQGQGRGWTPAEIDRAIAELHRTDRLLKSASMTDRQAIEELLLRLSFGGATEGGAPRISAFAAAR